MAVSGLGVGVAVGGCFWFRRCCDCQWLFLVLGGGVAALVLALGWLLMAVSGFAVGVAVGGCFWFQRRGGWWWLLLVLASG